MTTALMNAALASAAKSGAAVLEIAHASASLGEHLKRLRAFSRETTSGAYFVKWTNPAEGVGLDQWSISGVDGDFAM